VLRNIRALSKGRLEPHGHPKERGSWDVTIEGASAEMAVAKALGRYWADSEALDYDGDVGTIHVRSTDLDHGHLLLYPSDPDDGCFFLVSGRAPRFTIRGWIIASDGKREEFWETAKLRDPAWMVPASALHDVAAFAEEHSWAA
jgi:hypothetical protein